MAPDAISVLMGAADNSEDLGTRGGNLDGTVANDVLVAVSGENDLSAGAESDLLIGGIGSDTLDGGAGDDVIVGDVIGAIFGGADTITGGAGNDVLQGGKGADIFVLGVNHGDDVIAAFDAESISFDDTTGFTAIATNSDFAIGTDKISLDGFETVTAQNVTSFITQTDDGAIFSAEGTSALLYGVDAMSLSDSDFLFG